VPDAILRSCGAISAVVLNPRPTYEAALNATNPWISRAPVRTEPNAPVRTKLNAPVRTELNAPVRTELKGMRVLKGMRGQG
jgi:hypothetical protein